MKKNLTFKLALLPLVVALSACGSLGSVYSPKADAQISTQTSAKASLPAGWHAALPHNGQVAQLTAWWQQFDDPLLAQLIEAAERVSPNLASAKARIAQARANEVASGAALLPSVNANAGGSRSRQQPGQALINSRSASLDLSWEIDVFGGNRAGASAAQARLDAARADWHDARVLVAAEVAKSYLSFRACEARLEQARIDAVSRHQTLKLSETSAQAGMQSPGNVALSRASAAQGEGNLVQQRAQCETNIKALVALTAMDETVLRAALAPDAAHMPQPAQFRIASMPAEVLAQRPDLLSAALAVEAASADVTQRQAQNWPRIGLSGSIGPMRVETGAGSMDGTVWSLGPVSVTLPLFDGGTRSANIDAARERYNEAVSTYRASLRNAVREVEEALISLQSTDERAEAARVAAEGFGISFRATEARWRGGMASLFELEDARRSDVQAQTALIDLQRERVLAWIALYRAVGGGWQKSDSQPS